MLKDKDLLIYLDRPEAGLAHWAMRNAVKTGRNLELEDVKVSIGEEVRPDWLDPDGRKNYMVWIRLREPGLPAGWELLAYGYVGQTPIRYSLCGEKAGPKLFSTITWLRFLGLSLSMTDTGTDFDEVFLGGLPIDRAARMENRWIETPPREAGKELN